MCDGGGGGCHTIGTGLEPQWWQSVLMPFDKQNNMMEMPSSLL